jgi:epoxyqueuosine reductase
MEGFKKWVIDVIKRFVRESPENRMDRLDGSPLYEEPLVGFVSGDDPLFNRFKEIIGPFHLTPREAVERVAAERKVNLPERELGVISYILPISEATVRENAGMKGRPSERWCHTRLFGEDFNLSLQRYLVSQLEERGCFAVAPSTEPGIFQMLVDEKVSWASTWSQRHVAYAANLGTFGLSDGLITSTGKAHRAGSVIVNQELDSSERSSDIHRDCLFYRDGSCRMCIDRCPAGAITEKGHDKQKCAEFIFSQVPFIKDNYHIDIYACGLCQAGVSCDKQIPVESES